MEKRGAVNIEIANCLHGNLNLLDNVKVNGVEIKHSDVYHIMIGRWYYGVYLIAKSKLGCKNEDNIPHTERKDNNGNMKNGIWELLGNSTRNRRAYYIFKQKGEALLNCRNKYEYSGFNVEKSDFDMAYKNFKDLENELQQL